MIRCLFWAIVQWFSLCWDSIFAETREQKRSSAAFHFSIVISRASSNDHQWHNGTWSPHQRQLGVEGGGGGEGGWRWGVENMDLKRWGFEERMRKIGRGWGLVEGGRGWVRRRVGSGKVMVVGGETRSRGYVRLLGNGRCYGIGGLKWDSLGEVGCGTKACAWERNANKYCPCREAKEKWTAWVGPCIMMKERERGREKEREREGGSEREWKNRCSKIVCLQWMWTLCAEALLLNKHFLQQNLISLSIYFFALNYSVMVI